MVSRRFILRPRMAMRPKLKDCWSLVPIPPCRTAPLLRHFMSASTLEVVRLLVDHGADIDALDYQKSVQIFSAFDADIEIAS
jgi:ankyrin repeat protein